MFAKSSIKQFLRLDWRKVLIAVLLYLITTFVIAGNIVCIAMAGVSCGGYLETFVIFSPLAVILYLISCVLILIFDKGLLTKERIKYFFKPHKKKLVFFVLLFFFFQIFFGDPYRIAICDPCGCNHRWGYPFTFLKDNREKLKKPNIYEIQKEQKVPENKNYLIPPPCGTKYKSYNYYNLFYDIIFWYLVSCFLVSAWDKVKNNKIIRQ